MSERKAINKWYPPDYDPSKVKKVKKVKKEGPAGWPTVRLMIPFSMKCLKCNEYIPQSRKFNAKKEVTDKDYLGIKILHFHFRCPRCFDDLVFGTDPQNGDMVCVSGCKPNYERKKVARKKEETREEMLQRLEEQDRQEQLEKERAKGRAVEDPENTETGLEQLEKRLTQQQKEQEMMDEIDELQERNRKIEELKRGARKAADTVEAEEAAEAARAFKKARTKSSLLGYSSDSESDSKPVGPVVAQVPTRRRLGVKKRKFKVTL